MNSTETWLLFYQLQNYTKGNNNIAYNFNSFSYSYAELSKPSHT